MSAPTTASPNVEVKVVSQEMAVLSNILAAYTFIADQPERTALVFLGGVCVGLLVTLVAIVFQIHCRADCHYGNSNNPNHRHRNKQHHRRRHTCPHHQLSDSNPDNTAVVASPGTRPAGDSESEDWEETSDLTARRRRRFERALLHATMFTSAEVIYCFVYYLWVGHNYCYAHLAGFTALFLLPGETISITVMQTGWGPQWLSYLWYLSDGRIRRKSLTWTHILHLGIFKRLWECMRLPDEEVYCEIMQQADVSALRLFEALVVTLPETLLQTYVLICTDIGIKSPGKGKDSNQMYVHIQTCEDDEATDSRDHFVSMLGSRFGVLMLFTRIFKQWILGVIGVHWLGATFWMVSQQTDIIRSTNRWRLFNLVLGAIHIFLFLNVKYGQSRYRMAGFYLWEGWKHHHWLLIRLALKTGDVTKIWSAYGEGGLAGLMGLSEEVHSPDEPYVPRVREVVQPPKPTPTCAVARPVRRAPPTTIQDMRRFPEVIPVQEVIPEESADEEYSGPASEGKGDEEFQSAAYGSPTPSSPRHSLQHIDSQAATLTEASSSACSLDIKTPAWSPERRSPLLISSPEKKGGLLGESSPTLYFSADPQSPSSGSYLGWGSELSPISTYRSPYRIREARFITSTPRLEARAGAESPGLSPVVVIPATPGTTPGTTPGGTPGTSTPAASTPGASTPGASTPGAATPGDPIIPLTPVISHARKQMVQFVDSRERAV
ncbi:XK-related protein 5 [Channa argus]|uniref:XK-related protein n=1 Tax=Channa argus TaxID=215402 RepID=A0A6G1P8B5_CHAAH|nr:XK-related protein 5 [Channa argus]